MGWVIQEGSFDQRGPGSSLSLPEFRCSVCVGSVVEVGRIGEQLSSSKGAQGMATPRAPILAPSSSKSLEDQGSDSVTS